MKKPRSGSEPRARYDGYFYKHAKQYDWSVWLVIPRGRWGQQLSVHKSSRFACVLHWFCFWQCFWSNLTSVLEERFPARRCDRHSANQTGKVNYNSVDPWYRQIPVPDRLFIPSTRNNFGCVSSEVSGGLSYLRTAKRWHFNGRFEQWRLRRAQSAQRSLCFSIRKTLTLLTKREMEILTS